MVKKYDRISTIFLVKNIVKLKKNSMASMLHEHETIANAFNSYLNSISIILRDNINNNLRAFKSYLDDQIQESDNFHQTDIHEITKIIKI